MRVLIVDDSTFMRSKIKNILEESGHQIVGMADNGEKAIDMVFELKPDLVTLDNILPDMTGIDVLKILKQKNIQIKVIMISAVGQQSSINDSLKNGALNYLVKPFDDRDLLKVIQRIQ